MRAVVLSTYSVVASRRSGDMPNIALWSLALTLLGCASASTAIADAGAARDVAPPGLSFERQVLDTAYRAEGVGAFDVNGDGHPDIVIDQYWLEGPALTARHPIRAAVAYDALS